MITLSQNQKLPNLYNCSIAIIGIGYVGLPLAIQFTKVKRCLSNNKKFNRKIIGFDIDKKRVEELKNGSDRTNEITNQELSELKNIKFTSNEVDLLKADVFIVTVPTPVDENNNPDLTITINACKTVARALKEKETHPSSSKPVIIFESTFYPGATEEICIPTIEDESKLKINQDFFCGYSPERINPGDNQHRLNEIVKLTSGSDRFSAIWIDNLYKSIIEKGTYLVSNIKIAEAAKVIENTQRDINIALINELTKIFDLLQIDTLEVLDAARTKWNFLDFRPGLVGGHCIGVDPYYLTYKSQLSGYKPEVVLAGRKLNNSMALWISEKIINHMRLLNIKINSSKILIMGLTFKENCPDIRNSKVFDLVNELTKYELDIILWDPLANKNEVKKTHNLDITNDPPNGELFEVIICLVKHIQFQKMSNEDWLSLLKNKDSFIFDFKGIVSKKLNVVRP